MIPHEYIEELTRRTDIVELVGGYVQLKRKGRLYGGLCPFHSEKTPSFYVYPDTQSFYCFGCGAGGDAVTFTKKINSIDYVEAVKLLAQRAGMPEPTEDDKTGRLRSRILTMNKDAARFFHACLNSTVEEARQARAYWRRRGLDDKTINRCRAGKSWPRRAGSWPVMPLLRRMPPSLLTSALPRTPKLPRPAAPTALWRSSSPHWAQRTFCSRRSAPMWALWRR